jgi:hypothetical protein
MDIALFVSYVMDHVTRGRRLDRGAGYNACME